MPFPASTVPIIQPVRKVGGHEAKPAGAGDGQQVTDQMLGCLITPVAVLGHQLGDHIGQLDRNRRIECANIRGSLFLVLDQLLKDGPARKRRTCR